MGKSPPRGTNGTADLRTTSPSAGATALWSLSDFNNAVLPRYQVALGNALAGEVVLPMEGVSAGGCRSRRIWGAKAIYEAKLRGHERYQVQLGNEERKGVS